MKPLTVREACRRRMPLDGADAQALEGALQLTERELQEAREQLEAICSTFERTVAYADWRAAGSPGMGVPFHDDFASIVQLPSAVEAMRRWVRSFRRVLGPKEKP